MCPKCYGQIPEEPVKKITKTAILKKWINEDPFADIHFKQTKTNRDFLNESELRRIIAKDIDIERLQTVRDIFIFCSFTGLAFTDVKHLKAEHIVQADDGRWWIRKAREKNGQHVRHPPSGYPPTDSGKNTSRDRATLKGDSCCRSLPTSA